jgi:short-subunit dehydrogenase
VLLARRNELLQALATELRATGTEVQAHAGDVTQPGAVAGAVSACGLAGWPLDLVIANAGFSVAGSLQSLTLADYRRQYETNVFGLLQTVYESLPALRATRGQLALVGSVAGYAAASGASAYASSKFAVRAIAESLRGDLAAEGIAVTLVSPGFVDSDIRRTDNLGQVHALARDPIPAWLRMRTAAAARAIATAIDRRRAEVVVTLHGKLIVLVARHFPRLVRHISVHYVRWRKEAAPP